MCREPPHCYFDNPVCRSSLPASIKRIGSKTTEKRWRHRFPHCKSMGAFCWHGNQSFDPICPKTLWKPFPHPSDATRKIWSRLANWLQRSSLKVWTTTEHWYTISSPYKPSAQVSLWCRWNCKECGQWSRLLLEDLGLHCVPRPICPKT